MKNRGVHPLSAMGTHHGTHFGMGGSPSICDAGAATGAGLERCRAIGSPGNPPSLLTTKHAWVCQAQRGVRVGTAPGTQPRGHPRAHPGHDHDRDRPTRAAPPPHPRVDTLRTCTSPRLTQAPGRTEPFRAARCLYRAVRSLTGPHRGAVPPRALPLVHSFIHSFPHPRRGNEPRAPRAGSAAPCLAPPPPRAHE